MLRAAATFLHDMATGKQPRWLSFLGTSGTGKTMLGTVIWRAVHRLDMTQSKVEAGVYFPAIAKAHFENSLKGSLNTGDWTWLENLANSQFAFVDEIGGDLVPRRVAAPNLASLAEKRLGRWTIWTGNVSLQTLKEDFDARIASRMGRGGSDIVEIDAVDFNLRPRSKSVVAASPPTQVESAERQLSEAEMRVELEKLREWKRQFFGREFRKPRP